MPPPQSFHFVHRSFERFEFDPAKSQELLETRGFDLGHLTRMFPGYVLERQDTRPYPEPRYQVIGELLGEVFVLVYTPRDGGCRLITAWRAERPELDLWHGYFTR